MNFLRTPAVLTLLIVIFTNSSVSAEPIGNGIRRSYYRSGALMVVENIKNGKKEGPFKVYNENGTVKSEGYYKNNEDHGLFKRYYENGKVMFQLKYKGGQVAGLVSVYSKKGKLIKEWDAEQYLKMQEEKQKAGENAPPAKKKLTLDDIYELVKEYDINGNLKSVRFYKNNFLDGVCEVYDQNGQLKYLDRYHAGVLVDRKEI